jgi:hypothetical protein
MGDFYNVSSAISNGELTTRAGEAANDAIRLKNKNAIEAAQNSEKQDKEMGLMGGIKDSITESTALSNLNQKVAAYKDSVKGPSGYGGWNEVAVTKDDFKGKPPLPGEETLEGAERPSAAITTSEGTLDEGSDIINKGGKFANAIGDTESIGSKVAGATLKGVGIAGGLASAGLDIAQDFKGGFHLAGDNWEEKLSNIGTIGGAALDMVGLIPGLQFAGVLGAGIQAASGVLDAAGEAVDTAKKIATDDKPPPQQQLTGQQTLAGQVVSERVN